MPFGAFTYNPMKTLKIKSVEKQLKEGKIECVTDLRIGFVEIRSCFTNKRITINVI
jgi:hypothetical protein